MSFADDSARWAEQFFGFEGAALERITRQLAGAKVPKLRVKPGLNAKGQQTLWLRVYDGDQPCGEWENSSHICPPICD